MKLPRIESPLTGDHSMTSPGYWTGGVLWFLSLAGMMTLAKLAVGFIGTKSPRLAGALSDIPFDNPVAQARGGGQVRSHGV
jgi:hypothetical protein